MDFKCMSIGSFEYGFYNNKDAKHPEISNVNFDDFTFDRHKNDKTHPNYQNIKNYLTHLSVCHTVILSKN